MHAHEWFKAGHGDAHSVLPLHNLRLPVPTPEAMRPHGACSARMGIGWWLKGSLPIPTQPSLPVPVQIKKMWGRDGIACSILSLHCPNYWLQWGMVFLGWKWWPHQFVICWSWSLASPSCPPIFLSFFRKKRHACCMLLSHDPIHIYFFKKDPIHICITNICWQLQKRKRRGCSGLLELYSVLADSR